MQAIDIPIVERFQNLPPDLKTSPPAANGFGSRAKKIPKLNLFVDDHFHIIEVLDPEAYADNFWSTEHGINPRCFHRLNQKIFAVLLCELQQIQNKWEVGGFSNADYKVMSERFHLIDEKVGKNYRNEKLATLVHKHPKFPAPSINWDLVCM